MAPQESTGHRILRTALLAEAGINLATGILPLLFAPEVTLSYIAKSPAHITPLSKSIMQWTGACLVLATAPLLLSYPEPASPSSEADRAAVLARRRLTYAMMCVSEVALPATMMWQWLSGVETGIKDSALLMAATSVAGFGLLRAWILFTKGEWMEVPAENRKAA